MSKLRGLHKLVSELPPGFSIDSSTGILYYSDNEKKEIIGKVSLPEDDHYSFSIYFERFGKEKYGQYQIYWDSLRKALDGKKPSGRSVLMLAPIPRL